MKLKSTEYKVQGTELARLRIPRGACPRMLLSGAFRNSRGFAYVALLVAIVIIGISLGAAGKYWQNVMLREKEAEMFFRGDQYRLAIEHYYTAVPGRPQYPQSIDDLLTDNRTPSGKRHLRQKYKDPITGEDFGEIRDPRTKAIVGVYSTSEKEPLKKDNFPAAYHDLAGKSRYRDWLFIARAKPGQAPLVLQLTSPGGETPGFGQEQGAAVASIVQPVDTSQAQIPGQPLGTIQTQGSGQVQVTGQPPVPGQPQGFGQPPVPGQPQGFGQPQDANQPQPIGRPKIIRPPRSNYNVDPNNP